MLAAIPADDALEPFVGRVIPANVMAHAARPGTKSMLVSLNGTAKGRHPKHGDCESDFVDGPFTPVAAISATAAAGRNYRAVSFDAGFLRTLADSLNAKDGLVTLLIPEGAGPIVVIPRASAGFGLLMPCTTDKDCIESGLKRVSELA